MKKINLCTWISCLALCYACQSNTATDQQTSDSTPDSSSLITSPTIDDRDEYILVENQVLFPATYRNTEIQDLESVFKKGLWFEIYKDQAGYHITEANYSIKDIEEDPCSGYPAQQIISKKQAMLLFNIPTIPNGAVDSIAFDQAIIYPGKPMEFTFHKDTYRLEASGITFFEQDTDQKNYTLKLFKNEDKEGRILINQSEYNDTATELLFMGDLDKDGQVDFIFSSPRDYEEDRVLIILSGSKMIYEGSRQFDC